MQEEEINKEQELAKFYKKADLLLECSCGHLEVISKLNEGEYGIQMILPASPGEIHRLTCTSCGTELKLYYKDTTEDESVLQGSEEKQDVVGVSEDTELLDEPIV